jgi:phage tail P2-like protein
MWKTIDIVPSSIREDPQVQAACLAIDEQFQEIYNEMPAICFWPFVNQQVPPLLDVLAWEMHVDVWQGWSGDLDIATKRDLIEQSIDWHQHKGTKYAVEQMLKTVFTKAYVTEWYQYGGNPYFFKIIVQQQIGDPTALNQLTQSIIAVKNARSWLEGFEVSFAAPLERLYIAVIVVRMVTVRVPVSTNSQS